MNTRHISARMTDALCDTPALFLRGSRQTGKTTLVKALCEADSRQYITLDSASSFALAREDPTHFIGNLQLPVVIDEVQRVPALLLAVKARIDEKRVPGAFLLTGSANVMLLPKVSDSLAGRMEIFTLSPFSQGELHHTHDDIISTLFQEHVLFTPSALVWTKRDVCHAICVGGYPEAVFRHNAQRREAWFNSYLTALIERDVRDIANIQDSSALLRLLRMLATRSACLHNASEIGRSLCMNTTSVARYIHVFEALFLVWALPTWSRNLGKRFVKSPKLHIADSGLCAFLCGADTARLESDPLLAGRLFESFIASELQRQATWTAHAVSLYHYRTHSGEEVDIVLEDRAGYVVGIEVKLGDTLSAHDAKGLVHLRESLRERFIRGVLVYTGKDILPISDRIWAIPVTCLFS